MKLPFSLNPIIDYANHHAYISGIVSLYPKCRPYLFSDYINIYSLSDPGDLMCDFLVENQYFSDGGITQQKVIKSDRQGFSDMSILLNREQLWNTIKQNIDSGYYVYGDINERYIPCRGAYDVGEDFYHNFLIIGYNEKHQTVNYVGYGKSAKLSISDVKIDDLWKGITRFYRENSIIFLN